MSAPSGAAQVGQGRRPPVRRPWPTLPRWFIAGIALASVAIIAVLAFAVVRTPRDTQPVAARRTPSAPGLSHDVGKFQFHNAVRRPVGCGAVAGLEVAGATQADVELLTEVVGGVCKYLRTLAPPAEDRVVRAARAHTLIGFAQFERTGEDSSTIAGSPPRIAINTRFSVSGKSFKGYLAGVLMHELMHAGADSGPVTAEEEFLARSAEHQMCDVVPHTATGRSCGDARAIVELGRDAALAKLRSAGYR